MYNKYVTEEKIAQYDKNIDEDTYLPSSLKKNPNIREVCRAGLYLYEELEKLNCPDSLITRIQWTAGKLSFNKDPWEIHSSMIEEYKNNSLVLEKDPFEETEFLN